MSKYEPQKLVSRNRNKNIDDVIFPVSVGLGQVGLEYNPDMQHCFSYLP